VRSAISDFCFLLLNFFVMMLLWLFGMLQIFVVDDVRYFVETWYIFSIKYFSVVEQNLVTIK